MIAVLTFLVVVWGVMACWTVLAWLVYRSDSAWFRPLGLAGMVAVAASLPMWLWDYSDWARGISTLPAFLMIAKTWELGLRRLSDGIEFEHVGHVAVWVYAVPEGHWPIDPDRRAQCRKRVGPRAVRFSLKFVAFLGLLALNEHVSFQDIRPVQLVWMGFTVYVFFSGVRDAVALGWGAIGVDMIPMFDAPPLARNPRDFWGRRWNLWFTKISQRLIFQPLGGRSRPILGSGAVFLASAFLHEVIASVGLKQLDGRMTVFFLVHMVGTMVFTQIDHRWPKRLPRWIAVPLHFAWLMCTAGWFLDPMNEFIFLSNWTVSSAVQFLF